MALVLKDRVKETTTTTGTGSLSLLGASVGYQAFSVIGNGNTCYYAISSITGNEWEVGIGTYSTTGPTLARTTILSSSNSGSVVNLSVGTKDVYVVYPAEKAVYEDANDLIVQSGFENLDVTSLATINVAWITAGTIDTAPAGSTDIVNKAYVDALVASGIHFHQPVRVESPINLNASYNNGSSGVGATLTNAGTQAALVIDGVTVAVNDRVLVYQQTDQTENGVYVVTNAGSVATNWVLTRSDDTDTYGFDSPNALSEGSSFFVQQGTTGAGETYTCNTVGVITFGTTNITFVQVSSAQIYSAGTGLTLSGTQFSITPQGTAGTYGSGSLVPVFTTNDSGQVTSVAETTIGINANQVTSGTLEVARGGTNISTYVTGDLLYANAFNSLDKLSDVATGNALLSGGTNTAPFYGKVGLGTHISGVLAVSNGGTGLSTLTANGVLYASTTSAFSQDANFVYSSSTLSVPSLSLSSNLTFTGTGNRIRGDFSNATVSNRVAFQSSTTNGNINAGFLPNGTATQAVVRVYNNSDPTNAAGLDINANSTTASLNSIITGTGTYLPLTMLTGGSERLRIDTSGNVGIGATSITAVGSYRVTEINGTGGGYLRFSTGGGASGAVGAGSGGAFLESFGANPVLFYNNNAERMRITSAGDVGIGTSNPQAKFQVGVQTTASSIPVQGATIETQSIIAGALNSPVLSLGYYSNAYGMDLWVGTTGLAPGYIDIRNNEALIFRNNTRPSATPVETMRITAAGNVGIGNSSPASRLDVTGPSGVTSFTSGTALGITVRGATASTDYSGIDFRSAGAGSGSVIVGRIGLIAAGAGSSLSFGTSNNYGSAGVTNTAMTIDPSGNVGIGTTTMTGRFNVVGGRTFLSASSETYSLGVRFNSGTGAYYVGATNAASPDMVFSQVGGSETMRLFNSRGVSIGNQTDPGNANLSVTGTVTAGALTTGGAITANGNNNYSYQVGHGNWSRVILTAANNGAGTGDAGLYQWISEPAATWTGAAIARNRVNSSGSFPRVNTALSGQMMRFDEGTGIAFSSIDTAGVNYSPLTMTGNDVTIGTNLTAGGSLVIGSNGTYVAGCLYSDSNWGMIIRAKTASPAIAQFYWTNSAGVEVMRLSPTNGISIGTSGFGVQNAALISNGDASPSWSQVASLGSFFYQTAFMGGF
jgi:hypothetical protein